MNTFEEKLNRLEELTQAIKKSDISLEDALKSFEEGIKLARGMETELDSIESKIQILMNTPEEEPTVDDAEKPKSKKRTQPTDTPILDLFNGSSEVNGTRNA